MMDLHAFVRNSEMDFWCGNLVVRTKVDSSNTDQRENHLTPPTGLAPMHMNCCKDLLVGDTDSPYTDALATNAKRRDDADWCVAVAA